MNPNVLDTETTGLPAWNDPSDAPHQPHLVEVAAILFSDQGKELDRFSAIIKPEGWAISPEVAALHGITHEMAMDVGISEAEALEGFLAIHARADLRVAHSANFDDRIIRIAISRYHGKTFADHYKAGPRYCTAQNARSIVALPRNKVPTLGEAYKHFFDQDLVEVHRAVPDAEACARIYFTLQGITLPAEAAATAVLEA
ncbi:TPA: 3'-5' exonuclease [Pseudomonas aeruginosa]|nr:3'-5' exonuclease [Pseudomonas aeruginosa]HBO2639123.1 3'-5' exonuclease [Pseudomonas aeruginosa]